MKKLIFLFLILSVVKVSANNEKYIAAMSKHIHSLYTAQTTEQLQNTVNAIDRIAKTESALWEPGYYVALGNVFMATREADVNKKDVYLDLAKAEVDRITKLSPDNAEIFALDGFINMIRITVNPAARGQQYSFLAMQSLQKANSLGATNARALALMAQMEFGTAKYFNQQPVSACDKAKKAAALFEQAIKPENPLAPIWGKEMTAGLLKQCEGL